MQGVSVLEIVARGVAAAKPARAPERPLFEHAVLPRYNPFSRGLALSIMFHCLLVVGVPPLLDLLPESDAQATRRYLRAMRPLELRIPERLYLPPLPAAPSKPPAAKPKPKEAPAPVELTRQQIQAPAPAGAAAKPLPKEFRPPSAVRRSDDPQTLIQAHLPPDLALEQRVRLPEMVLLDGPVLPRPAPRRFVEPGRSAAPTVVPRIDAPPPLAGATLAPQEVRIPPMLAGPEEALLHLPRPTQAARPFQAPAPVPTGRGASVSPTVGEPINILAISPDPAPIQDRVTIPAGNQIGRIPELPAYRETGVQIAAGKGDGLGPGSGAGSGPATGGRALLGELAKALAALPSRYATPVRVEHPVNAAPDIVVEGAAGEAVPESVGVLRGHPVYTVYLDVGAPKAWLLQYCIPKENADAPQAAEGVVNIGNPAPVKAPFPLVSYLPPVTMIPRNSYIIVRAMVDASGQFRDAVVLRAPSEAYKQPILDELARWQMRPAVRNGAPVAVEVLLAIPPQRL